jgi:hypothetical protein
MNLALFLSFLAASQDPVSERDDGIKATATKNNTIRSLLSPSMVE